MNQRLWIQNYPSGTAKEINPLPAMHLPEMFRKSAQAYPELPAYTQCMPNGFSSSLSYAQVERYSDNFACYLREHAKLKAGDRVAIQMPNCLMYPIAVFGILKAGCVLVNTNPLYTAPEMLYQFNDSEASALVIIDMFTHQLAEVLPKTAIKTVITVSITEFFSPWKKHLIRFVQKYIHKSIPKTSIACISAQEALQLGSNVADQSKKIAHYLHAVRPESIALLQYTGGTTGVSKGAMLSHENLMSNMMQMLAMTHTYMVKGKEVVLTALPLYHIFAFTVNLMGFYFMGAQNILIPSPRPASNLKKAFSKYKITWTSGVNTLFNTMLQEEWFQKNPPKTLKATVSGGMSLHVSVAKQWETLIGSPIIEGYGLTESSPLLTVNPLGSIIKIGSIGVPAPSTELRLVDEDGKEVLQGETGEIIAKGPQIMLGYWRRDEETAKVLKDGWLYTGDIATMDKEGYFTLVDRKKDMIVISGFNVYPNEVEQCIAEHPDVIEVAVIGEIDDKSGERVKAVIVRKNTHLSKASVIEHCRKSLAAYKVPKVIEFRVELPKSTVGKILRKDLRSATTAEKSQEEVPA